MFDYLEHIQTAIITLYSAIESLINILIPDEFILEERNNKGIKEMWDKSAIERWKSTSEKLKVVIPKALAITNPTSYKCWSKFCEFEALRNDIVHIKSHLLQNEDSTKKIIGLLIEEKVFAKLKAAEELIKEISKSTPFHPEFPILDDTETLKAVVVDTFDESLSSG